MTMIDKFRNVYQKGILHFNERMSLSMNHGYTYMKDGSILEKHSHHQYQKYDNQNNESE